MEKYIAELEAQRIAELEAYLVATGLSDYMLTKKEETALERFKSCGGGGGTLSENSEKLEWKEFEIGELFEVKTSK